MDLIWLVYAAALLGEFWRYLCLAEKTTPDIIRIGIILEDATQKDLEIIELAFEHINNDKSILPDTTIEPRWGRIPRSDPFSAIKTVCSKLSDNITAILSSTSCETSLAVQSLVETLKIPHVEVSREKCSVERQNGFSVSIRPDYSHISRATLDLMLKLGWTQVSIFYDSDTAYRNVEDLLLLSAALTETYPPHFRLFRLKQNPSTGKLDFVHPLHTVKDSDMFNSVAYCSTANNINLIRNAAKFGMTSGEYHWIVASHEWSNAFRQPIDDSYYSHDSAHREPIDEFRFFNGSRGILTLLKQRVSIDPTREDFYEAWLTLDPELGSDMPENSTELMPDYLQPMEYHKAYLYDAVRALAVSISDVVAKGRFVEPEISHCYNNKYRSNSRGSNRLKKALNKVETDGLMGVIQFNRTGYNEEVAIDIISVEGHNNVTKAWKIGSWDHEAQLTLSQFPFTRRFDEIRNKRFNIVTIEEAPFVTIEETVSGPKFTGFCIDMLDKIAEKLDFTYDIYLTPDSNYGGKRADGSWNGLVGQVYYGLADMAVAGMVINSDRETVVDFTKPFMNYGVGILLRKPQKKSNVFAFLEPLDIKVWGCVLASLFVVGFLIYILDRLSPYSSYGKGGPECDEANDFNLQNSLWFAFASCLQQGGDNTPISVSGRMLSAFWWFFALIIIATYTANLAAFLTVTRMENPINSLEDLANQNKIIYGTIENSSLHRFFEKRKNQRIYERMWDFMSSSQTSPWVPTDKEGYRRVKQESYAFFWDAPILDYIKQTECDLMTVGKPFNLKGYGIATPQGAAYRDNLSVAILKLQEEGILEEIKKKWFERESICPEEVVNSNPNTKASAIGLSKIAGAFYVLIIGAVLSFIAVIIEHMWHKPPSFYKRRRQMEARKAKEKDWGEKLPTSRNNGSAMQDNNTTHCAGKRQHGSSTPQTYSMEHNGERVLASTSYDQPSSV
ncbi:glutamate receptor ionotropic, kainate 1-like [Diadema antillarum]|uniref:glutamate receptor ionotropic, kainate 1-like n=1 Tax=Diadema antillarum TaxID=105358 RepID=UPI003A883DC0